MKYSFNEKYFDEFTEQTCYWLGFIAADGCVVQQHYKNKYGRANYYRNYLKLRLAEKDKDHLETFAKDIGAYEHKLYNYRTHNSNQYGLNLNSEYLVQCLIKLGITPRKSLTLDFPCLPENQIRHFIRGYFDGDGTAGQYGDKKRLSIIGTEKILTYINNHIHNYCGIKLRKLYHYPPQKIYTLQYNGKFCNIVLNYLKSNSTRFLERKYILLNDSL